MVRVRRCQVSPCQHFATVEGNEGAPCGTIAAKHTTNSYALHHKYSFHQEQLHAHSIPPLRSRDECATECFDRSSTIPPTSRLGIAIDNATTTVRAPQPLEDTATALSCCC
mmetsp:Transcript_45991/g.103117  ORF Transcript_45991/g.103117 Transcript_45991/m.103117 type:complete len:111 (+) Transcript_45991:64-396(+)